MGERGREVREFLEEDLGEAGLVRSVVVVATSDSSPLLRRQAAYAAMTIAEHFRDEGKSVLLRWEVFNALNHPNLSGFQNVLSQKFSTTGALTTTSAAFGTYTSTATNMRQMQATAKFQF